MSGNKLMFNHIFGKSLLNVYCPLFCFVDENGKEIPVPRLEHARKVVMGAAITGKSGSVGFRGSQAPTKS